MYSMIRFPNHRKLILVVLNMAMKCIAVLNWVMQPIKTTSMKRTRCDVQQQKSFNSKKLTLVALNMAVNCIATFLAV